MKINLISASTDSKDKINWSFKTDNIIESSPFVTKGEVFFGSDDKNIYALTKDGKLKWKFETGDFVRGNPIVNAETLYCGSDDGYMYAINIVTGKEVWRFKTNGKIRTSPCLLINHKIYFGSTDNNFYCLETYAGKELWKFETKGEINSVY